MVECLTGMEALGSIPSISRKRRNNTQMELYQIEEFLFSKENQDQGENLQNGSEYSSGGEGCSVLKSTCAPSGD